MDIKTDWFLHYYEAMKKREKSGVTVDYDDGIIYLKWSPVTDCSDFNVTYVDKELNQTRVKNILNKTQDYNSEIMARQEGAEKLFPNNLKSNGSCVVYKLKTNVYITIKSSLKIEKITNLEDLRIWAKTASTIFPEYSENFIFDSYKNDLDSSSVSCYIGYENDIPVAVSQIVCGKKIAGVFWVGVIEKCRRKGFGKDITAYAINDFIKQKYNEFILIPSNMAVNVYKALDFVDHDILYSYKIIKK